MSNPVEHRAFFGDQDRAFTLTPMLIAELERSVGAGIGALSRRTFAGDFRHADLIEVIRLGLVGGGEAPARAAELVALYASPRPLSEVHPLATAILERLWWGSAGDTP